MYRTAKTKRVLVNDPNYVLSQRPSIRSIIDVLDRIESNDNISHSSTGISSNEVSVKPKEQKNVFKRQKTSCVTTTESPILSPTISSTPIGDDIRVFKVIYGLYKPNKKHKQFSSDGFLTIGINDRMLRLYSIDGKGISQPKLLKSWDQISSGKRLVIGSRELEIDDELDSIEFRNKKYFQSIQTEDYTD